MLSLLILAVLAGFLFLVMTNQLEQVEYFVLTKIGIWKQNEAEIFYGSANGSHPVVKSSLPEGDNKQTKENQFLLLRKDDDKKKIDKT